MTESHLQRFLAIGRPTAPRRARCRLARGIGRRGRHWWGRPAAIATSTCNFRLTEAANGRLWADAEQLRQLLLNLVLNAIEAAGPGGWVRIELVREARSRWAKPAWLQVRVLDSGPGPSAELAGRLFEPFVTGKPEGIGLGLAVARQIAEAHGGAIRSGRRAAHLF